MRGGLRLRHVLRGARGVGGAYYMPLRSSSVVVVIRPLSCPFGYYLSTIPFTSTMSPLRSPTLGLRNHPRSMFSPACLAQDRR